jgi:hypothetical protein
MHHDTPWDREILEKLERIRKNDESIGIIEMLKQNNKYEKAWKIRR